LRQSELEKAVGKFLSQPTPARVERGDALPVSSPSVICQSGSGTKQAAVITASESRRESAHLGTLTTAGKNREFWVIFGVMQDWQSDFAV
jgi:hypothetical protein